MARVARVGLGLLVFGFVALVVLELRHVILWRRIESAAASITVGMSRDQVVARLGRPDTSNFYKPNARRFDHYRPYQPISLLGRCDATIEFRDDRVERVLIFPDAAIRFDAADWRAANANRRGCMAADLRRKVRLQGMPAREIIALLGPPDHDRNSTLFYKLGIYHAWDIDGNSLTIVLDKDRVATAIR